MPPDRPTHGLITAEGPQIRLGFPGVKKDSHARRPEELVRPGSSSRVSFLRKLEHSSPRPASGEGGPNLEQGSHTSYGPPRPPVQVKPDNNDARKG